MVDLSPSYSQTCMCTTLTHLHNHTSVPPKYTCTNTCALPSYTCISTHVHCPQYTCTNTYSLPNTPRQIHMWTTPTHLHKHTCALSQPTCAITYVHHTNTPAQSHMCTDQHTWRNTHVHWPRTSAQTHTCTDPTHLQKHTCALPQYTGTNTHMNMVACICNPRTVEVEAGASEVQSYPGLPEALSQKMFLKKQDRVIFVCFLVPTFSQRQVL